MPTARPRHMITETDDIARALDIAARHWPHAEGQRTELLRLIIATGAEALDAVQDASSRERLRAAREFSEVLDGVWPADWREQRDAEWPA